MTHDIIHGTKRKTHGRTHGISQSMTHGKTHGMSHGVTHGKTQFSAHTKCQTLSLSALKPQTSDVCQQTRRCVKYCCCVWAGKTRLLCHTPL